MLIYNTFSEVMEVVSKSVVLHIPTLPWLKTIELEIKSVRNADLWLETGKLCYWMLETSALFLCHHRVIDVGSEWRTFSNEKANADPSRVGGTENALLNGTDLSTMIGPGTGSASFDEHGVAKYQNRRTVSCYFFFYFFEIVYSLS